MTIQGLNPHLTPAYNKVKLTPGLILIALEKSLNVVPEKTRGVMFYCRTAAASLTHLGALVLVTSICVVVLFMASLLLSVLGNRSC